MTTTYTFKAQAKSNAKRFLVSTCKLEDFNLYLTQHEGQWGTWLDSDGAPVLAATAVTPAAAELPPLPEGVTAGDPAYAIHSKDGMDVDDTGTAADYVEPTTAAPSPAAFAAFAASQLTAEPAPVVTAPAPAPAASGIKIQKERETRNGVQRQSPGSIGDNLWLLYDTIGATCTLPQARAIAAVHGYNPTSAAISLYRWRHFNGYTGK